MLDRAALLEKAFAAEPENFETAYNIGEAYRMQSFEGGPDYPAQAETAMRWYARAMQLNPFDGYNDLRTGMCLDWLDRHAEAGPFYSRAEALDPNGYFTVANIGWHYVQVGDYLPPANGWSVRCGWNGTRTSSATPISIWWSKNWLKTPPAKSLCPPVFEPKNRELLVDIWPSAFILAWKVKSPKNHYEICSKLSFRRWWAGSF